MSSEELEYVLAILEEGWLGISGEISPAARRLYELAFSKHPADAIEAAVMKLIEQGQEFRPNPAQVMRVADVEVELSPAQERARWQRRFLATADLYGRDIAIAFHDPHGRFMDWRLRGGGGEPSHPGGRRQLIELGALDGKKSTT